MHFSSSILALLTSLAGQAVENPSPTLETSVDPGGCQLEHIAVTEGTNQYQYDSFSPDGTSIAIAWDRGGEERGTYLLNLHTMARTNIPAMNNGATFSPDGAYLVNSVYVSNDNTDIVRYNIETEKLDIFAPNDAWDWLPSYAPDGSKILFNSFRSGNSDIYLYDLASKKTDQLTNSITYEAHAQFSPDGLSVVFHEQVSASDFNVNLLTVSSGNITPLTNSVREESYPSWSPDGNFIAFASDRGQEPGITDIFIMNKAGDTVSRITDMAAKDAYPFWSPDGSYLYFTSYREPQGVYRTAVSDLIRCDGSH